MNAGDRTVTASHCGWLLLILAGGLWLRVIGFTWGLPTTEFYQTQTFYPDEQLVFITLKGMDPTHLKFRPSKEGSLLGLGPFYAYLVGGTVWAAQKTGLVNSTDGSTQQKSIPNVRRLYELGRSVNVALGLLTIIALFIFAAKTISPSAGLLSAFILTVLPIHVFFCHTMARDISQMFFWTMSLVFLSSVEKTDEILLPGLAGLCLGLSAACKYSSVLLGLSLPMGLWLLAKGENVSFLRFLFSKGLFFILLGGVAGYLAGNPYSLLAHDDFVKEFLISLRAVGQLQGSDAFQTGGGWKFFGWTAWIFGAGSGMAAVFAFGFLRALFRRDRWDYVLLAAAIPYLAVNMASHARFVRYLMPLIPLAIYWSCRVASDLWTRSLRKSIPVYRQTLIASALWIVLIMTAKYSWSYVNALKAPDARILASDWIRENIPPGSTIATAATPYFHHPSIIAQQFWHPETIAAPGYRIINLEFSRENIAESRPDFIVLSDYDYFPLQTLDLPAAKAHPRWVFLDSIFNSGEYRPIKRFAKDLSFFGPRGGHPFFPHDWRYPFPTIIIFKRADMTSIQAEKKTL